MTLESIIRALAGTLVLVSLALFLLVGPWGLVLALFVGLNLLQSAFTGFCPAEKVITWLGLPKASRDAGRAS
jgi:hypothetical protein